MTELYEYRQHQGTWEKIKENNLKAHTVDNALNYPDTIAFHLEFLDHMINWTVHKQLAQ